jgi:PAS domain S-box-containing protein
MRDANDLHRLAAECIDMGIWVIDSELKTSFVNARMAESLGYPVEEIMGQPFLAFISKDAVSAAERRILGWRGGGKESHMFEFMQKDGSRVWPGIRVSPLFDGIGDYAGAVAEESLRKSEQRFKTLLENAYEGITVVDANGKILYESPGFSRMMGYSAKDGQGVISFTYIHPDDKQNAQESFTNTVRNPDARFQIVVRVKHKDGTWRWIECIGRNLTKETDLNGLVVNFRDITERKRMEEELQKTQKLESLGLLAGGIAHDFNNLLGGIFGYIDLALVSSKDGAVSKYLSAAMGAMDRARHLTRQLLTFSKGGAPVRETGEVSSVIRDAASLALSGSNVSCTFHIADTLWLCTFDKNQIGQVIDNIVINAQQAMPLGGAILISAMNVSVKAGEKATVKAGDYVKISISDEGIGIPADILPRIFDPFFTTKQKGSGLGLSICHSILQKHNGGIEVESAQGKGTTLHLYLPASSEAPALIRSVNRESLQRGGGRILIMDDEEIIRQSVGKMLDTLGYSVECASDGKGTLEFLSEESRAGRTFVAMLLDLTIPGGMGGKDVAAELRKLNIDIPLFMMSGYSDDPVVAHPEQYGFKDCICKPFSIADLASMLSRHLRKDQT